MNLNQLKYFVAVCETRTVSGAAEILHISQPSVSGAVKELEDEFGVKLFLRKHRGMALTAEGERFYKMGSELLARAEQTENIMKDIGNKRKILRLGIPPMIGAVILPHIYSEFREQNPDVQIEITEEGRHELLDKLSDDMLDMVIMSYGRFNDKNLSNIKILNTEIVLCTGKNSPLAEKESVTAKELEGLPLVLFKDSFYHTEEVRRWFSDAGVVPEILMQTEQLSTIQSVISKGVAIGFMFKPLVKENTEFATVKTSPSMPVNVSLVWKKDAYLFSGMKKFRDYISKKELF